TDGNGKIDTWLTLDSEGIVIKSEEDQLGDGKPDVTMWFKNGKPSRLEQDSHGKGCVDLRQWFTSAGKVRAEYVDNDGNCKTDSWSYFEADVLVRQGQDTNGNGRPNFLNHFNKQGEMTIQELANNGRDPDQKLMLGPGGVVTGQCSLDEKGKKLNTRAVVRNGQVTEVLYDGSGNGIADTREVYENGALARLDADTNGDGKPDVTQFFTGGKMTRQDEDLDYDGSVDRAFQGQTPLDVGANTPISGAKFGKLGCGSFHGFWWKR
ncbi:MAG: hypothetical protein IIA30_17405, partial [Myxococcales bacterium]|nr:hypothetical protein [Myxococcales bacterium]